LYEREQAVARVQAAAEAARGLGFPFQVTARAENHIRGHPDLADTIARLQAFEAAGADVLYAPGLGSLAEIRAACAAVSKPVNVLAVPQLTVAEIVAAGAQRISVGGALTWVAAKAVADAATAIRDAGDLSALAAQLPLERWLAPNDRDS
jgi:2-methylisocitrate lyase-like PEP mutase family enzyme